MIGVLVFPDFQLLDAAGPISVFEIGSRFAENAPAIKVVIAPDGFSPRAIISTPEEERTGPGVTATTLIDGAFSAKRAPISNTEIGPAASSNWKSGNTRMPIIMQLAF